MIVDFSCEKLKNNVTNHFDCVPENWLLWPSQILPNNEAFNMLLTFNRLNQSDHDLIYERTHIKIRCF